MTLETWYTVYDADTDEVLAIGNRSEVERRMGWCEQQLLRTISKMRAGLETRYIIVIDARDSGGPITTIHPGGKQEEDLDDL